MYETEEGRGRGNEDFGELGNSHRRERFQLQSWLDSGTTSYGRKDV